MPSKIPAGNKNIIRVRVIIHIITAKIKPHILFFKIPTAAITLITPYIAPITIIT